MIYNIQALRGLAVLLVVVVHSNRGILTPLEPILFAGNFGVDLFFVISGFVMVYTTARKPSAPGAFLLNRFIRIAPIYYGVTLFLFVVARLGLPALQESTPTVADLIAALCFFPHLNPLGLPEPVLGIGWSLNYEMAFYALFAVAIAFARGSVVRMVAYAAGPIVLLVAIGAVFQPTEVVAQFYTNRIMIEFVYGMVLALLYLHGRALPVIAVVPALVAGVALVALNRWLQMTPHSPLAGLAGLCVVAPALTLEKLGYIARSKGVQLVGAASYVLYLIHQFVMAAGYKLFVDHLHSLPLAVVGAFIVLLATIPVAILVHLAVERPLTDILRRMVGHRPSVVERAEAEIIGDEPEPTPAVVRP